MRKLIFAAMLMCFCTTMLFAQVPDKVKVTFTQKYPDVTVVKWFPDHDYYRATFMDANKMETSVILDKEGRIIRREMRAGKDYPTALTEYYMQKYPSDKNYQVFVTMDEAGNKSYYIQGKDVNYYFDKDGKFTREEKREMREEIRDMKQ